MNNKKIYNSITKIVITNIILDNTRPYRIKENNVSIGAGFFIDKEGHILTAAHVIQDSIEIWINLPIHGKKNYKAEIVCVYPDFDLAIIKILDIRNTYSLNLGDSDKINIGDKIYALGHPNNSDNPLRTEGTVSGRREIFIQGDVPINAGNSGGPVLNKNNEVIGVSSAKIVDSENSSLIVPINLFKNISSVMLDSKDKIIYKNVLGILLNQNNKYYFDFNKIDKTICNQGAIISKIYKNSPLENILDEGDIFYKINDKVIDFYGELNVEWEEAKVSLNYIINRTLPNQKISITIYSIKEHKLKEFKNITLKSKDQIFNIRDHFNHIEKYQYEVFGGIVVMNLNINHILEDFKNLIYLINTNKEDTSYLVISYVFENSKIAEYNMITNGLLIDQVNQIKVKNIEEYKDALKQPIIVDNKKFISIKPVYSNEIILDLDEVLEQEKNLIKTYQYNQSDTYLYFNK